MENTNKPKEIGFTWQRIIQAASVILVILFFCPAFQLSVLGFKMKLSGMNIAFGKKISMFGVSERSGGSIFGILLLLLPIAIFCIWQFYLKIGKKLAVILSAAAAGLNLIIWIWYGIRWSSEAKDSFSEFGMSFTFWIDILLLIGITAISVLIILGKLESEKALSDVTVDVTKLQETASGLMGAAANAANKAANSVAKATANAAKPKTCPKCGSKLKAEDKFCNSCGEKYIEPELAASAEDSKQGTCPNCGAKTQAGQEFCPGCGQKL